MYSLVPAFVSALFLGFGLYVWMAEGMTRQSAPFGVMCVFTCAWQGIWAFLFQTSDPDVALTLVRIGYLFILFLPTTFYHFITEVTARRRERPWLICSYLFSTMLAVILLTGDDMVAGYHTYFFGPYPRAGILHPIHLAQTALLASRSGWLLLSARSSVQTGARRRLLDLCLLSLLFYSLAAVDYAVNYGVAFYPPGAIFIAVSLGILAVAVVRYGLMRPYALAASVAHEVATPLAAIGLHADELNDALPDLVRGYQLAAQHGLFVDEMYPGQTDRLLNIVSEIRNQVDATSTVMQMSLASFTLDKVDRTSFSAYPVQHCVNLALERFPFRGSERSLVAVAPIDPHLRFWGQDVLLTFVIFNLLKNALYAIQAGGRGNIEISASNVSGACQVHFSDTGPGISTDVLPHIFDDFFSTKSHGRGAGMGLAFCRRVIRALEGEITCKSELGTRTLFTIRLPLPPASRDTEPLGVATSPG
ncbi:sensor histidine kinase [Burkholderia alba]|uniref:sensor histidine kinase n=1 Tax=Burkholderia alba TaxID=2683677 RepID=UPI002B0562C4|nr:HAMP domain-containing sensor histidine kinase [Burkholderia alba]